MAPWRDYAPCHFLPDGGNQPAKGTPCPPPIELCPAIATAGRHQRVCVPTSRRPHPHLLESGLARSPFLTHHPWCQRQRPSLRWIRDKAKKFGAECLHHPTPAQPQEVLCPISPSCRINYKISAIPLSSVPLISPSCRINYKISAIPLSSVPLIWMEAEPVDLGTGIDLTPWLSVRRIAPSTRLRQQVRRRGRRYMRFR